MPLRKSSLVSSLVLAALLLALGAGPVAAQGSVTPSYGNGMLTLVGEGYRPGERVGITVRTAGSSRQFTATADSRGRFRVETGLTPPPLSSVEIEARDEQGVIQATTTGGSGGPLGPAGGNLPPAPSAPSGPPPTPTSSTPAPSSPLPAPTPSSTVPSQLPRTGGPVEPTSLLLGLACVLVGGLALRCRFRRGG